MSMLDLTWVREIRETADPNIATRFLREGWKLLGFVERDLGTKTVTMYSLGRGEEEARGANQGGSAG